MGRKGIAMRLMSEIPKIYPLERDRHTVLQILPVGHIDSQNVRSLVGEAGHRTGRENERDFKNYLSFFIKSNRGCETSWAT